MNKQTVCHVHQHRPILSYTENTKQIITEPDRLTASLAASSMSHDTDSKAQFRAPDPTQLNSTQLAVELS